MSWQLFSAPAANLLQTPCPVYRAGGGVITGCKPKTWMMALAVVSLFAPASDHAFRDVALMALGFLAISVACLLCWAWLGKAVNRIFRTTVAMVRFQRAMALCLFISALDGNAGLGQSTTHTTLRKPQNIFRQTVRCIHIRTATVHQHAAQATFQHQLHLLRDHCRVIHFKRGQQLVCELVRGTFC